MNTSKLAVLVLMMSVPAFTQSSFNPAIQIEGVRSAVKALDAGDRDIKCSDPNAASNAKVAKLCDELRHIVGPDQLQVSFTVYALGRDKSSVMSFLASAAESRLDTQNGANSSGSGTTSVVERSGISDVLGAALEAGAVTQSVNGSTLTLQGNALSLVRFLTPNTEVFQYCPDAKPDCDGKVDEFLNRISGSASLGLSNQSAQTVTGTVANSSTTSSSTGAASGSASQMPAAALIQDSASHLTGFSLRFQAINHLDLRSKTYLDAWTKAIKDGSLEKQAEAARAAFEDAFKSFYNPAEAGSPGAQWLKDALEYLRRKAIAADDETFAQTLTKAVTEQWDEFINGWPKDNNYTPRLRQFLTAANTYMAARDTAVNNVRQKLASGLTFEYDYSRPDNQPRVSTARVIYTLHPGTIAKDLPATTTSGSKSTPAGSATGVKATNTNDSAITLNFAADMYDNPPPGTGILKDIQAALQLDHHFGNTIGTLAGYYQYQDQPSALMITSGNLAPGTNIMLNGNAATLLAPRGHIVVAQAMVTFPLKSGTKLPVGVTWSNRTDLIKGNELRGHVGFNFDWSNLLLGKQANSSQP
jgi:hypothetical protein